jgi:peroxidase
MGQFLDHDIDLTNGASPPEHFSIAVPVGDLQFDPLATGTATIGLDRSQYTTDYFTSEGHFTDGIRQ